MRPVPLKGPPCIDHVSLCLEGTTLHLPYPPFFWKVLPCICHASFSLEGTTLHLPCLLFRKVLPCIYHASLSLEGTTLLLPCIPFPARYCPAFTMPPFLLKVILCIYHASLSLEGTILYYAALFLEGTTVHLQVWNNPSLCRSWLCHMSLDKKSPHFGTIQDNAYPAAIWVLWHSLSAVILGALKNVLCGKLDGPLLCLFCGKIAWWLLLYFLM